MKEVFGWFFIGLSVLCITRVFAISAMIRRSDSLYDPRSVFEREHEHHSKLAKNPEFILLVFLGLVFVFTGIYLIGMFFK